MFGEVKRPRYWCVWNEDRLGLGIECGTDWELRMYVCIGADLAPTLVGSFLSNRLSGIGWVNLPVVQGKWYLHAMTLARKEEGHERERATGTA